MTARSLMTERAVIERDMATGRDRNNQPNAEDWQALDLTDTYEQPRLPCFLWSTRERVVDGAVNARVETLMLGVPQDAPITPADRIRGIYDRAGVILEPGPFKILADQRMGRSHRELTLEDIAGAAGAGS